MNEIKIWIALKDGKMTRHWSPWQENVWSALEGVVRRWGCSHDLLRKRGYEVKCFLFRRVR